MKGINIEYHTIASREYVFIRLTPDAIAQLEEREISLLDEPVNPHWGERCSTGRLKMGISKYHPETLKTLKDLGV